MPSRVDTRDYILEHATALASRVGLTGLTLGALSEHLGRPKSSISSRFRSRERLQIAVLEFAAQEILRVLIRPAMRVAPGLPRLRHIVEGWLAWDGSNDYPGGCLFVAAAAELDDRPGPVRDRLVRIHRTWQLLLRTQIETAIASQTLPSDTDPDQLLQEIQGILLACHLAVRLHRDAGAEERARRAIARLLGGVRPKRVG